MRSFTKTPPWAYNRAAAATTSCASFGKREVFLNPENQLAGKTVTIDMIRTQHGDAVNICSVGFDAKVAGGDELL